jgi:hypothetical protein
VLRLLQLPTSRELVIIRNAMRVMATKGEREENVEMMLLLNYPECCQDLLKLVFQTYIQ